MFIDDAPAYCRFMIDTVYYL